MNLTQLEEAARAANVSTDIDPLSLGPHASWHAYATREGLLNDHGVAPHPALTQAAYNAFRSAWNAGAEKGYAEGRSDEEQELSSVLPGVTYMDPPDGGAPTILEQLQRQAKDAERYRWLRSVGHEQVRIMGHYAGEAMDAAIDAALRSALSRLGEQGGKG